VSELTANIMMPIGSASAALIVIAVAAIVGAFVSSRRQRAAVARLEERVAQLGAALSLLTNTTEEGLRGVATEVSRLAGASEVRTKPQATARERIATAAGSGRSVQDIAASERVSEGEVLLHLLMEKLRPETADA
jgi:NAD/NADP transhydrogenase alpha subunit